MARPIHHFVAFAIACLLVLGIRIQDRDLRPLVGSLDARQVRIYTPYFPGLGQVESHEIFSPAYAKDRKIVFLGASAIDSIGCDGTWSVPDPSRDPEYNAHYSCSIAYQLTQQLHAAGYGNWRAFNLARNGAKLTSMLYVYARLLALKPDIVILGERFPYYMEDNADASSLTAAQYAYLEKTFASSPETAATWKSYLQTLKQHGLVTQSDARPLLETSDVAGGVSLNDLIVHFMWQTHQLYSLDVPPLPVRTAPYKTWSNTVNAAPVFANPDPQFGYFQGVKLIADLQKQRGGKFLFYFSPQYKYRANVAYNEGLKREFGGYLQSNGISWVSYVQMPLAPYVETYDGTHQTLYGNRKIAAALLGDLRRLHLLTPQ